MAAAIQWWLALLIMGAGLMPFSNFIFRNFRDRGWLFSKVLALLLSGWLLFCLVVCGALPFTHRSALLAAAALPALCWAVRLFRARRGGAEPLLGSDAGSLKLILAEEALFLALLLLALYVIGFRPEAYGTEKFMDYAFLTSMARSTALPFEDPWFAGETVNYYYGGQYMAAFLMKLTNTSTGLSYNVMRALVTSLSFLLPFSLVFQMMADKLKTRAPKDRRRAKRFPWYSGVLGGLAVAFCGNGHYLVYGIVRPVLARIRGEYASYWFPDSTRYIGYDPDLPDKTIHEFPAYSSILGDLHAHYVNLIFVITIVAVVYAWAQKRDRRQRSAAADGAAGNGAQLNRQSPKRPGSLPGFRPKVFCLKGFCLEVFCPEVLLIGLFTGVFRWTNAADFAIYYVVCGSLLFFVNLRAYRGQLLRFFAVTAGQAACALGVGFLAALPFTMTFQSFTQGIHLTHSHSPLYQLMILWELPTAVLAAYAAELLLAHSPRRPGNAPAEGEGDETDGTAPERAGLPFPLPLPDLAALLFGLCAAGLVLLPELVYIKDIYGEQHHRANTMFKLTYEAFILFAIMMAYVLLRAFLPRNGKHDRRAAAGKAAAAGAGLALLILTAGYTITGVGSWFGSVLNPADRIGSDASVFVAESFESDFGAIDYLNTEVAGRPAILEAPGDSYSDYERVSVATGLPTVAGWYVHEWLWRNGHDLLDARLTDIQTIYTSADTELVRLLLRKYNVEYVYIGRLEREKYPGLQEAHLRSIGEAVYSDENGTCILKME